MLPNKVVFPVLNGTTSFDEIILFPTFNPSGAIIYLFSLSEYLTRAILDDLFGSYSIDSIIPEKSNLFRLKSIIR